MKSWIFIMFVVFVSAEGQDVADLSDLPFAELLAGKKFLEGGNSREEAPTASALVGRAPPGRDVTLKGMHNLPWKKTFHEDDYEDDKKAHKKEEHKMDDILNTSIMALSYLAFGGYLLCMIANALREKRRRFMMAYPSGATFNNQFAQVLQHHMIRPARPFVKFPTVTVHQGGKKRRRRRSTRSEAPGGDPKDGPPPLVSIIDYVDVLAHDGD